MTEQSLPEHTRLGTYELLRRVARGGMADIYLARGERGLCAVKVMSLTRVADPEAHSLFLDEGRVLGMLAHANLAGVYEVANEGHCHYLAMEYVHGADLRELLATADQAGIRLPYEAAVAIVSAAGSGLDHAHRRCSPDGRPMRLVHRDVSLSNIMVAHDGGVKVIDFGIARAAVSEHQTNPGVVRGKASYMSPEQALGEHVDLRTDVFALGVVLYELTTGRRCFTGQTDMARMIAVVHGQYVPPSQVVAHFPPGLERVIQTALATDRTKRYASAAALVEALEEVAALEDWQLGATPILALMQQLYGAAPDPFEVMPCPVHAVPPTVVITRPRRHARGTQPTMPADDDLDDQPTRGRRSLPSMFAPRAAA